MSDESIAFLDATELVHLIRTKQLSAVTTLEAHLIQIAKHNKDLNAVVTLVAEKALDWAKSADDAQANGKELGVLHGLPVAHKDLHDTAGILTTHGSPLFADNVPTENFHIVDRMQDAGAITLGKTNTPEFGAGSQTYNPIFGATVNPYDLSKTCGGSSGGAAVALATGMIALADGSDMGGSLRNPAAFCNIVGFRPSPGRVSMYPRGNAWSNISVYGPMARTVSDVGLLLSAISGFDRRSPISIREDPAIFRQPLDRNFSGVKVAWSQDFGGIPIDPQVTSVLESQKHVFADIGCTVADAEPDFTDAHDCFMVSRAERFAADYAQHLETNRDKLKESVIWNTELGLSLSALDYANSEKKRTELYHRVREFMNEHHFLICPVTQVPPFDVNQEFISEINGVKMESYIDWMQSCYFISVLGLPAASVPCGFTEDGLPIGIQIVGRHQDDLGVLQLAYAFEQATQFGKRRSSLITNGKL